MSEGPTKVSGASKAMRQLLLVFLFICVAIIASVVWIEYRFFVAPSNDVTYADNGFEKAKATIDPEKLRAWASEEIPGYPPSTNDLFPSKINRSEIPDYMRTLYSTPVQHAVIWKDVGNTNTTVQKIYLTTAGGTETAQSFGHTNVAITWGGPFFHWWFMIGPTNFVRQTNAGVKTVEWVPGIYYEHEN